MAERIINVTCPNCKHGIKHDTLMNVTSSIPPEDYPTINEHGRCWCKTCQHGTYPTEEGLCSECLDKGRSTRLQPKAKVVTRETVILDKEEVTPLEEIDEELEEEETELEKKPIKSKTNKTKKT